MVREQEESTSTQTRDYLVVVGGRKKRSSGLEPVEVGGLGLGRERRGTRLCSNQYPEKQQDSRHEIQGSSGGAEP